MNLAQKLIKLIIYLFINYSRKFILLLFGFLNFLFGLLQIYLLLLEFLLLNGIMNHGIHFNEFLIKIIERKYFQNRNIIMFRPQLSNLMDDCLDVVRYLCQYYC